MTIAKSVTTQSAGTSRDARRCSGAGLPSRWTRAHHSVCGGLERCGSLHNRDGAADGLYERPAIVEAFVEPVQLAAILASAALVASGQRLT